MGIQIGDTVGDYQVVGVLGKGGMGKVFRVRSLLSDREEAMKVISPDVDDNPELADRFLHEIKVHASLDHPNIAAMHTALRSHGRIVMILELVEGVGLDERIRQGPLDTGSAVHYTGQVLSALAFAHLRGVIHRDIKPANILITAKGLVKLTDFGIARAGADQKLTHTGFALGSLPYMSPEQIRTGPVDARSDIYSLGITLYEMVTGRRPIQGDSEYALMNAQLVEIPVPPADLQPALPRALSDLIMKALAKEPERRFQSALEFQAALQALRGSAPSSPAITSAPAPTSAIPQSELARVESKLVRVLGPIARRLVSDAGRLYSTVPEMCRKLAEQIPEPREREAFLKSCLEDTRAAQTPSATAVPTSQAWDAAVLDGLAKALAPYIGPIAKVVVKNAARKARSPEELYDALAAEIPSDADRRRFLSSLRR
jgi:serine/threonine-protein kinase